MNNLKSNISSKYVFFYLIWTFSFTAVYVIVSKPEKLTWSIIIIAVVISAILSIPAMRYFFKLLKKQEEKNGKIDIIFLPEETLALKMNASLKSKIINQGGVLFLTNKRILFIGGEFFNKNKTLLNLDLNNAVNMEREGLHKVRIRNNSVCYTLLVENVDELCEKNSEKKG